MKYFLDLNSLSMPLSKKYFDLLKKEKSYLLNDYMLNTNFRLNQNDLKQLLQSVYVDENQPFGKIDKYTDIGAIETDRNLIEIFYTEIDKSMNFIKKNKLLYNLLTSHIIAMIPLREINNSKFREHGSGSSMHWLKGGIFLSLPYNKKFQTISLAVNIIHELGHQCLMTYQQTNCLINDGYKLNVYSAIRKTSRPAILSFHALVALHFISFFLQNLNIADFSLEEKNFIYSSTKDIQNKLIHGAFALKDVPWTNLGHDLFEEIFLSIQNNSIKAV